LTHRIVVGLASAPNQIGYSLPTVVVSRHFFTAGGFFDMTRVAGTFTLAVLSLTASYLIVATWPDLVTSPTASSGVDIVVR
jgi:hypothetical protein